LYFVVVSTLLEKTTLEFPSYELLWAFKNQTRAIHIHIQVKKNIVTGTFSREEIEIAIEQFKATLLRA